MHCEQSPTVWAQSYHKNGNELDHALLLTARKTVPSEATGTAGAMQRISLIPTYTGGVVVVDEAVHRHETPLSSSIGLNEPLMTTVVLPLLPLEAGVADVILGHEDGNAIFWLLQVSLECVQLAEELQKTHSGLSGLKHVAHDVPKHE
jgi:hypothetical protein